MSSAMFFVGHEFSTQQREDLRRAINEAFEGTGFAARYADEDLSHRQIMDKIAAMIQQSQFGIFDVSNHEKPNVFIELGYAMALGKRTYILCQRNTRFPSNLAGYDRIEYESYASLSASIHTKIVAVEVQIAKRTVALRQARYRNEDGVDEANLLANVISKYAAADLSHKFGGEAIDPDSSSGRVWVADLSLTRNHIIYGPYESPGARGRYRVVFKLKLSHNGNARDAALILDVFGAAHADRNLYSAEFNNPDKYQLFGLDFDYPGKGLVEYRVYNITQAGFLTIDYVAVTRITQPPNSALDPSAASAKNSKRRGSTRRR